MAVVKCAEAMNFSARQMFDLVNDVERYPEFLPWCSDAQVERRTAQGIVATLTLSKGPLHHAFTTENDHQGHEEIRMKLVRGPFKRLDGRWRFNDTASGCRVSLDLEFEFSNRILARALSKIFEVATSSMVDAFRQRAVQIYG